LTGYQGSPLLVVSGHLDICRATLTTYLPRFGAVSGYLGSASEDLDGVSGISLPLRHWPPQGFRMSVIPPLSDHGNDFRGWFLRLATRTDSEPRCAPEWVNPGGDGSSRSAGSLS